MLHSKIVLLVHSGYGQWVRTDSAARTGWAIIRRLSDGARYDVMVVVQSDYGEVESHVKTVDMGNDPGQKALCSLCNLSESNMEMCFSY